MPLALIYLKRALVAAALAVVISYGCDNFWIHWRLGGADTSRALGSVTFYYSTILKSGKSEIFFDQPQTEICSRSLYPQLGHRPCWYAQRDNIRAIGWMAPFEMGPGAHFTSASNTPVSIFPARLT